MAQLRASTAAALVTVAALVAAGGAALGGYEATYHGLGRHPIAATSHRPTPSSTPSAIPTRRPSAAPGLLSSPATDETSGPEPSAAQVTAALTGPLADPALGPQIRALVIDAATGTVLYNAAATTPTTPASTAKLATAVAVLAVHASSDRISTTIEAGSAPGQIVLVGAGDPTLSGAAPGRPTGYSGAARISDLVAQLRATHVAVTKIIVDGRLFTGPSTAPGWLPGDTPTDYASPITAAMTDGGRAAPTAFVRSGAPDLAAGQELAALLGLPAGVVSRGSATVGAKTLATVESAPYGQLVQQMLQLSDNVLAECLARQVAISQHQPASFAGAVVAIRSVLAARGVSIGTAMTDASGLAGNDRLAPSVLAAVLRLAATREELRPVIDDLPVADWNGTLAGRFGPDDPAAHRGAGLVRAKTGTLTSVSTLAGVVTTDTGRLLIFVFMAPAVAAGVAGTDAAESALDRAAAALVAV